MNTLGTAIVEGYARPGRCPELENVPLPVSSFKISSQRREASCESGEGDTDMRSNFNNCLIIRLDYLIYNYINAHVIRAQDHQSCCCMSVRDAFSCCIYHAGTTYHTWFVVTPVRQHHHYTLCRSLVRGGYRLFIVRLHSQVVCPQIISYWSWVRARLIK